MAAPALAAPVPAPRPRTAWIIGPRADLVWLLGSVLVSYGLLGAHLGFGISALVLWWVWIVALDGPHVFATLARTYLDRQERAARRRLLAGSLVFYTVGPAAFGASALLGTRIPFDVFITVAFLWAYWHVVRQHYGFMVLYKKKAGDLDPADDRADSTFLYVGLIAPLWSFALTHPRAVKMLGFAAEPPWARTASAALWVAAGAALLVLVARQIARARRGLPLNWAKLAFLAVAVSLSAALFSPPVVARAEFLSFVIVVTAFHNVQYLAIVWFYGRNRYHAPGREPSAFGAAGAVTGTVARFMLAGVAFTVAYRLGLGCTIGASPGCEPPWAAGPLAAGLTFADLATAFMWGFALQHYYLDQKIWKVRHDAAVSRDLKLEAP